MEVMILRGSRSEDLWIRRRKRERKRKIATVRIFQFQAFILTQIFNKISKKSVKNRPILQEKKLKVFSKIVKSARKKFKFPNLFFQKT